MRSSSQYLMPWQSLPSLCHYVPLYTVRRSSGCCGLTVVFGRGLAQDTHPVAPGCPARPGPVGEPHSGSAHAFGENVTGFLAGPGKGPTTLRETETEGREGERDSAERDGCGALTHTHTRRPSDIGVMNECGFAGFDHVRQGAPLRS